MFELGNFFFKHCLYASLKRWGNVNLLEQQLDLPLDLMGRKVWFLAVRSGLEVARASEVGKVLFRAVLDDSVDEPLPAKVAGEHALQKVGVFSLPLLRPPVAREYFLNAIEKLLRNDRLMAPVVNRSIPRNLADVGRICEHSPKTCARKMAAVAVAESSLMKLIIQSSQGPSPCCVEFECLTDQARLRVGEYRGSAPALAGSGFQPDVVVADWSFSGPITLEDLLHHPLLHLGRKVVGIPLGNHGEHALNHLSRGGGLESFRDRDELNT